jgi:transcriptional regulator with XRE-family HTH domain
MDIGRQVRRHRLRAGLTLEQLAERVNAQPGGWRGKRSGTDGASRLDTSLLSRIEGRYRSKSSLEQIQRGREITVPQWLQLAAALGVPPLALLVYPDPEEVPGLGRVPAAQALSWIAGLDLVRQSENSARALRHFHQFLGFLDYAEVLASTEDPSEANVKGSDAWQLDQIVGELAWYRELLRDDGVHVEHLVPDHLRVRLDREPTRDRHGRVQRPRGVREQRHSGARFAVDAETSEVLGWLPSSGERRLERHLPDGTTEVYETHDDLDHVTRTRYGPDGEIIDGPTTYRKPTTGEDQP